MTEKYIELNLNDAQSGKIAEILANKTAKKILGLLAEKELSESDIAGELKLALNTVDYNVKKLIDAGLIEKTRNFFWSVKGKKIPTYKLANKKIIISTKSSFKGMLAFILSGGLILGVVKIWMNYRAINISREVINENLPSLAYSAAPAAGAAQTFITNTNYFNGVPIWILIGLIAGSLAFVIYRKFIRMKGGKNRI